jgi:NAD(P)H-hydrate repair Nnr-like enzyme with NAD(P)H-hydrate dehydratase domain
MNLDYWHKQTLDKPLFPELIWSRPENRQLSGKLLIVGGNLHGFAAPGEAYNEALKAGVGATRVVMPDSVRKLFDHLSNIPPEMEFAPSTPSGSFGQKALAEILSLSGWADGILLAGDFGRNSETAIILDQFTEKYQGQLTVTGDTVDYFTKTPELILHRPNTTFVLSLNQLQKLTIQVHFKIAITSTMGLLRLVEALHEFTQELPANIVVNCIQDIVVAVNGEVSTTEFSQVTDNWQGAVAAHAAVWWLQNPSRSFNAITSSILDNK